MKWKCPARAVDQSLVDAGLIRRTSRRTTRMGVVYGAERSAVVKLTNSDSFWLVTAIRIRPRTAEVSSRVYKTRPGAPANLS